MADVPQAAWQAAGAAARAAGRQTQAEIAPLLDAYVQMLGLVPPVARRTDQRISARRCAPPSRRCTDEAEAIATALTRRQRRRPARQRQRRADEVREIARRLIRNLTRAPFRSFAGLPAGRHPGGGVADPRGCGPDRPGARRGRGDGGRRLRRPHRDHAAGARHSRPCSASSGPDCAHVRPGSHGGRRRHRRDSSCWSRRATRRSPAGAPRRDLHSRCAGSAGPACAACPPSPCCGTAGRVAGQPRTAGRAAAGRRSPARMAWGCCAASSCS